MDSYTAYKYSVQGGQVSARPVARLRQLALAVLEMLGESVIWPAPQRLSEAAPPPERWWRIV